MDLRGVKTTLRRTPAVERLYSYILVTTSRSEKFPEWERNEERQKALKEENWNFSPDFIQAALSEAWCIPYKATSAVLAIAKRNLTESIKNGRFSPVGLHHGGNYQIRGI